MKTSSTTLRRWQDYVESILIAVLLALVVRTFVISGYRVPTSTMAPVLKPGDFIFSYKLPYGIKLPLTQIKMGVEAPARGDVVVFTFPDQPRVNYVKRVIGLPGDLVQIKAGRLIVNSVQLQYEAASRDVIQDLPNFEGLDVFREIAPEGIREVLLKRNAARQDFGPILVPQGQVFLLGDNRDASDDSRYWGSVPLERVEGRVFLIWLSLDWSGPGRFPLRLRHERVWMKVE